MPILALKACALRSLAALSAVLMCAPISFAAERFAAPTPAEPITASPAGGLVQVTVSLLIVLAAVFAAAWAVRRLRGFGRSGAGLIEVIADVPLGQKERAVLVQVGKQQLLLGVASGSVNTLHVLPEPIANGRDGGTGGAAVSVAADVQSNPNFKAILKRSLGL
jgi:flagellar protein FliO/FliZ